MGMVQGVGAAPGVQSAVGIVLICASILYFTILEGGAAGATVGKRALRLRVVRPDGTPLGFGRALVRTFSRIISAIPLYLGFLWALIDSEGRAWHDVIARSRVVPAHDLLQQ